MKKFIFALLSVAFLNSCESGTFTICQVADSQLGFDAAVKGQVPGAEYVNDLGYESELLTHAIVNTINPLKPDVVVFTGDQVNFPDNQEQWDTFDEIISKIRQETEVLHLPGNHDVFLSQGKVDLSPFESRYGDDRFVYIGKRVCLIGLDSNLIKYDDPREEEQFKWLEEVLRQTEEDVLKLVFCHHPFFLSDIEEGDSYFPIQKAKRRRYFDLFAENEVTAVYAGHLHDNAEGEYRGVAMKTATSVAYQIGDASPSCRLIQIRKGKVVTDEMLPLSL